MWLRFLLYLHSFSRFGWYVRMVSSTLKGMVMFLIVFFIGVFAFADAFYSIESVMLLMGKIEAPDLQENASDYEKYVDPYITKL